jgi:hypothetical protein
VVCYITTIQAPSPLPPAVLDKHRTPRGDGLEAVTALAQRVVRCLAAAQERRRVWAEPTTGVGSDDRARDEQAAVRKLRRRGTMGGGGSLPAGSQPECGRDDRIPPRIGPPSRECRNLYHYLGADQHNSPSSWSSWLGRLLNTQKIVGSIPADDIISLLSLSLSLYLYLLSLSLSLFRILIPIIGAHYY